MTDVTVVGGGIIGLTAAIRLQERGARVTVLTADDPLATVSAVAAAVWYPTRTDPDPRVLAWATATREMFLREAAQGVPGVAVRPTRMLLRRRIDRPPWWAGPDTILEEAPSPHVQQLRFSAPLSVMDVYLPWLQRRIVDNGGRFVRRSIDGFDELCAANPVVVNATGSAAARLCGDTAMVPARGHVVIVDNPGLTESVRDEDNPAGITYIHPRESDVVLGGTFQRGRADLTPDPRERAAIVARCSALIPGLRGARVREERIGIRPVRQGGPRVAAQRTAAGGRLIHAYGHGGAGMTLSWGCADEVAELAEG